MSLSPKLYVNKVALVYRFQLSQTYSKYGVCLICVLSLSLSELNSYPPGQNGRHFVHDIFRCIFVNEKFCILIKISLKFVPQGPIDNNPALV